MTATKTPTVKFTPIINGGWVAWQNSPDGSRAKVMWIGPGDSHLRLVMRDVMTTIDSSSYSHNGTDKSARDAARRFLTA